MFFCEPTEIQMKSTQLIFENSFCKCLQTHTHVYYTHKKKKNPWQRVQRPLQSPSLKPRSTKSCNVKPSSKPCVVINFGFFFISTQEIETHLCGQHPTVLGVSIISLNMKKIMCAAWEYHWL